MVFEFFEMMKRSFESMKSKTMNHNTAKNMNLNLIGIILYVILVTIMILVSYAAIGIPIFAVCSFVVLEALLCICLNQAPIFVHGIAILAEIIAGIYFGQVVFVLLMVVLYVAAVALLYIWSRE